MGVVGNDSQYLGSVAAAGLILREMALALGEIAEAVVAALRVLQTAKQHSHCDIRSRRRFYILLPLGKAGPAASGKDIT